MVSLLKLLLPALFPSWRFFQSVEASPRVEWALVGPAREPDWAAYRPRPTDLSLWAMAGRLFWNPHWNEALFMVSLSERLAAEPASFVLAEISDRVRREIGAEGDRVFQFRLLFVQRVGFKIIREEAFRSELLRLVHVD